MRILICGTGKIARELLKRLGEGWQVTLVDKQQGELDKCPGLFPNIEAMHNEDASSPVVLDKLGVGDFDYVMAMAGDHEVNKAVAGFAVEKGAGHVTALVHDAEHKEELEAMDVHTVMASSMVAQSIKHYLDDPRMRVTAIASGPATIMEFEAAHYFRSVGRRVAELESAGTRVMALYRGKDLLFPGPDEKIKPEDKVVILGDAETFPEVCHLLECGEPHFPLAYGHGLLIALPRESDQARLHAFLEEGLFISRNTKVRNVHVLCTSECFTFMDGQIKAWPQEVETVEMAEEGKVADQVRKLSKDKGGYGLILIPPPSKTLLSSFLRASLTVMAHELECPLLIARGTSPYERVLLPFNGADYAEKALEVTIDMARQLGIEQVDAVMVEEPGFITGGQEGVWLEGVKQRLDELAHIHKTRIGQVVRKGNPVKEIEALSGGYDLMVIGSEKSGKGFFAPNVAEHLARKSACSVLVVP